MIKECFITHCDARFLPLAQVLVRGLEIFSSRPVILYSVDCDAEFDSPNLIRRRLDSRPGQHIAYLKLRAILETDVRHGIYLDADNVPNQGVDQLFDLSRTPGDYPLLPRHPRDLGARLHRSLMQQLGVSAKPLPYLHSCCMAFSPGCRPFIEECYAISRSCDRSGNQPLVFDESIVNVLLWKIAAPRYLESCNIDHKFFDCYLQGDCGRNRDFQQRYGNWPYRFLTFHYCKDPAQASRMLRSLASRSASSPASGATG